MFIADTSNRDIRITQKVHELDHMCVCVCAGICIICIAYTVLIYSQTFRPQR